MVNGLGGLGWEQLSLGLGMNFLPGLRLRPSPDQRDLLTSCMVPDLEGSPRTLQVWAESLKCPLTPGLQSEGRSYSHKLAAVSKFCISWGTLF